MLGGMGWKSTGAVVLLGCCWPAAAQAGDPRFRMDTGLTVSRFEQQVKTEVGTEPGQRLVEETQIGLLHLLTYRFWGPLSAGGYLQVDRGERQAARFAGFDADGKTVVAEEVGGAYTELWMGPLIRAEWRAAFVEVGYGALGARHDDARTDLPTTNGDTNGALRTHPTIAWLFTIGGTLPVTEDLGVALRLEYRIRYYVRRGSSPLADDVVHGTQNVTPFAGVAWRFGPR